MSSITLPPAMPTALRVSSCAHTPPYWPKAVPTTALGLPEMAPAPNGRDSQSMAFFRTAGMVPLYSGEKNRKASAAWAASRSFTAAAGTLPSTSMSSL